MKIRVYIFFRSHHSGSVKILLFSCRGDQLRFSTKLICMSVRLAREVLVADCYKQFLVFWLKGPYPSFSALSAISTISLFLTDHFVRALIISHTLYFSLTDQNQRRVTIPLMCYII